MYSIESINAKLLNAEQVKDFIKNHGQIACVCYNTDEKYAEKVGESCMREGHTSGSRGDFFKFEIVCPRYTADQIARHSVGVFLNMQSQRYVDMDNDFSIYVPPRIMKDNALLNQYITYEEMCKAQYKVNRACFEDLGITGEQANDLMRTMLPIGVKTKLRIGFTLEALVHFMHKRLCARADEPIREVAMQMRDAIMEAQPKYADLLIPQCEELGYCPEKHCCGRAISKSEFKDLLDQAIINKNKKLK